MNLAFKCGYGEEVIKVLGKLIANGHGDVLKDQKKIWIKMLRLTIDWLIVNVKELK